MARHVGPGAWQCNWCQRILTEDEFSLDGYRKRHNKGPGRCRDCDREYARAKTALSPSGKYGDADSTAAYWLAKPVCESQAWGTGFYSKSDVAAAEARAAERRIRVGTPEGVRAQTYGERKVTEAVRLETREREQVTELRTLDQQAAARRTEGAGRTGQPVADGTESVMKRAAREWRRRRRAGDYDITIAEVKAELDG